MTTELPPVKSSLQRLLIISAVLVTLTIAFALSPLSVEGILRFGESVSHQPLMLILIVVAMALLMTVGLPGSVCFWLIAPFHPPLMATLLLLTGSVAGALGAYGVGTRVEEATPTTRLGRKLRSLLARQSNLPTQIALRMLPGFPHAGINITAGILHLPLVTFTLAAVIGLAIKWGVYCSAVHGASSALQAESALDIRTLLPLTLVGLMMLAGGLLKRKTSLEEDEDEDEQSLEDPTK